MVQTGHVYKSKRNNKEYYRVVDIRNDIVNTCLFDLSTPRFGSEMGHVGEKHVDIYLPYFEDEFVERSEEELAMKLLSRL